MENICIKNIGINNVYIIIIIKCLKIRLLLF